MREVLFMSAFSRTYMLTFKVKGGWSGKLVSCLHYNKTYECVGGASSLHFLYTVTIQY